MTVHSISPHTKEYLDAAFSVIDKYHLSFDLYRPIGWFDIGSDNPAREEFQRLWWIEFGSIIAVPDYHFFGSDADIKLEWPKDSEREQLLFALEWL